MNPKDTTTKPAVTVTSVPFSNTAGNAQVNYNMGTITPNMTPPKPPVVEPPIATNSSGTGSVISTASQSGAQDNKTMIDVNGYNVNNADATKAYNDSLAILEQQRKDLEARRTAELETINTNFGQAKDRLTTGQASETGSYSATLARIGGYLGNTASATGAMISLNDKHQVQLNELEAKKQAAIQTANNAINDKQFDLARSKIAEIKDYTATIAKSKQDFFNNNKKVIEDQIKAKKDTAIAELYAGGTTDVPSILQSLQSSGLNITSTDIQDTIKNLVPPAVNDLIETLNKGGAPADVKLKVLSAKNLNEAYAAAGPWASLGGVGIMGEYNYYKADAISKGLTPVSFNDFQTVDANRKAGITSTFTGGSGYSAVGASGEYGAYQFMPETWQDYAGQILNDPNAPMTPANQDAVAQGMVSKWIASGKTPEQIAIKWNHGQFSYEGSGKGTNSAGVPYDIPGYVARFKENLKSLGGGNDPLTVAKAIKLTETGKSGDIPVERVVNVVLGSGKFTTAQRGDFINSMNAAKDPVDAFAIVKNKGRELLTGTTATKVEAAEKSSAAFDKMAEAFKAYYAGGGSTDIISGNFQQVQSGLLGVAGDPQKVYLAVQLETALQSYRNAISGTAYSVQEGKDIKTIFPGISNTETLNDAIIKSRKDYFETDIDGSYRSVFGPAYDDLKKEADKIRGATTNDINSEELAAKKLIEASIPLLDDEAKQTIPKLYDNGFTEVKVLEYLRSKGKIK